MADAAGGSDRDGRAGAVDRLRQRGQPTGGAGNCKAAGNRHPARSGCDPPPTGQAIDGREWTAGSGRRITRPVSVRDLDRGFTEYAAVRRHRRLADSAVGFSSALLYHGALALDWTAVRPGSRSAGTQVRCRAGAEGTNRGYERQRLSVAHPARSHRGSNLYLSAVTDRCRPVYAVPVEPDSQRSGIQSKPSDHLHYRSEPERLHSRAQTRAVSQSTGEADHPARREIGG